MTRRQRILLTGATGFIGRHVLARLRQTHDEVIAVGRRPLGEMVNETVITVGIELRPFVQPDKRL